mmetsp:Transcript_11900/g.20164  ORF Transcript_11900/g.20164 Transcript_11900/m.20164 type:complete len:208 (+) Transcript_11900:222-845(+)
MDFHDTLQQLISCLKLVSIPCSHFTINGKLKPKLRAVHWRHIPESSLTILIDIIIIMLNPRKTPLFILLLVQHQRSLVSPVVYGRPSLGQLVFCGTMPCFHLCDDNSQLQILQSHNNPTTVTIKQNPAPSIIVTRQQTIRYIPTIAFRVPSTITITRGLSMNHIAQAGRYRPQSTLLSTLSSNERRNRWSPVAHNRKYIDLTLRHVR